MREDGRGGVGGEGEGEDVRWGGGGPDRGAGRGGVDGSGMEKGCWWGGRGGSNGWGLEVGSVFLDGRWLVEVLVAWWRERRDGRNVLISSQFWSQCGRRCRFRRDGLDVACWDG